MARLRADPPFARPDCEIAEHGTFRAYVYVGRDNRVAHSSLGDQSDRDRSADISNAAAGRLVNIAAHARIGAADPPMDKAALHRFHGRPADDRDDADHDHAWFAHRRSRVATSGHGAVVAAGACWDWNHDGLRARPNDFCALTAAAFLDLYG